MRTAVIAAILLALTGVLASEPAQAHGRSRVGVGFYFGGPWYPYWHYPSPYYYSPYPYYPQTIVVPAQPTTYVEQAPVVVDQAGWWYYCDQSRGYYPYVRECPSGWQRVAPTPSGPTK